jgi:hypothetical protein
MSEGSLFHVLQFVRSIGALFKSGVVGQGNAMRDVFRELWKTQDDTSEFLRTMAAMQDHVERAIIVVSSDDRIDGEGRDGIVKTLEQVQASLSPYNLQNAANNFFSNIAITLSQLSLISGMYGLRQSPYLNSKNEIDDLIKDLSDELNRLDGEEFSEIRDYARKQIAALILLLRSADTFGIEAAFAAYFQLLLNVKRAKAASSKPTKDVANRLWPAVERWAGRLAIIEAAVTHSQSLITAGKGVMLLLSGNEQP